MPIVPSKFRRMKLTNCCLTVTRSKGAYSSSLPRLKEVTRGKTQVDDTVILSEYVCGGGGGRRDGDG